MAKVFISHQSRNAEVAEMIIQFFTACNMKTEDFFCSSLPGNDVKLKISEEALENIKASEVDIMLLSSEYYDSVYCMNEEGIIWFKGNTPIVIGLPEISHDRMLGFINSDCKFRRLDSETDIAAIYDMMNKHFGLNASLEIVTAQSAKLKKSYEAYIKNRQAISFPIHSLRLSGISLDQEKIMLYYILYYAKERVHKISFADWLVQNEIPNFDINYIFKVLSSKGYGNETPGYFDVDKIKYAEMLTIKDSLLKQFEAVVNASKASSHKKFVEMQDNSEFDDTDILFAIFISEASGTRIKQDLEEAIQKWESDNGLTAHLSKLYRKSFDKFVGQSFIQPAGNGEYVIQKSFMAYLQNEFQENEHERIVQLKAAYNHNEFLKQFLGKD